MAKPFMLPSRALAPLLVCGAFSIACSDTESKPGTVIDAGSMHTQVDASTGLPQAGQSGTAGTTATTDHDAQTAQTSEDAGGEDSGSTSDSGVELPGWKLVWHDEFEGAAGQSPDAAHWNFEVKGDGFGNSELEFYTARTENSALDGHGKLVITARKEEYMGNHYTSARMTTKGKHEQTYGRFETRMHLPFGQGIWPAFWMLGVDIGSAGWPMCGEIDMMENIGKEPSTVHGTLHGPGYSGGGGIGKGFDLMGGAKFGDDDHVFAVEWEENVVRWYVDGELYQTRAPSDLGGKTWVYDHPFFLIMNLAVGGQWPGNPDGTTTFPQTLTVDYVRVYERP